MKSNLYQCRICPHKYKEKELAKKCGAWCANNKSCNLEIIKSVESSVKSGKVLIKYEGERITPEKLNKIFEKENYIFSDKPIEATGNGKGSDFLIALGVSLILIAGFIFLKNSGLSGLINVNSK